MPVKITKTDGYRVTHGGKTSAKSTTKAKAQRQANLLRGIEHGWKPSGRKARDLRKQKGSPMHHVVGHVTKCGPEVHRVM